MTLLAAYNFDEGDNNVIDRTGNGHDFTFDGTNGVHIVGGHTNGGGTKVSTGMVPLPASLVNVSQTNSRTVMTWIKGLGAVWIIRWSLDGGSGSWGLAHLNDNIQVRARNGSGTGIAQTPWLVDDAWHHYAGTYDGNTLRLYVDGVLVNSAVVAAPLLTDSNSVEIMEWSLNNTIIDDLRIYDVALSDAEIVTAMNTPVVDTASAASGTKYYNGTSWVDVTPQFYNGTTWVDTAVS